MVNTPPSMRVDKYHTKYFRFSETKRINLNNIDTWLVNSFGFRILELEMATNESFEIGVQISSNPIFKMAEGNLANVKNM